MSDWIPEPRPVPSELNPEFNHATFTPEPTQAEIMSGVPIMDRLDETMRERLLDYGWGMQ